MLFSETIFVGVSSTAGKKPMPYAALNPRREVVVLDHGDREQVLALLAGLERAVVGVNAPQALNKGLMNDASLRRRYNLGVGGSSWMKWRACEVDLRLRNIHLTNTPARAELVAGWVREGFALYTRLKNMGYRMLVKGEPVPDRALIEVQPHAAYTALLERRPFPKHALEGRIQRQLVLYLRHLDVPNPLSCLEEVTRYHLLSGHLPLEELHSMQELDALAAAYTAYSTVHHPHQFTQVGDREEGLITLPVAALRDHYPV